MLQEIRKVRTLLQKATVKDFYQGVSFQTKSAFYAMHGINMLISCFPIQVERAKGKKKTFKDVYCFLLRNQCKGKIREKFNCKIFIFKKYILLIMLLQLSHFLSPLFPPALHHPPTSIPSPTLVHVYGSYI